MIFLATKDSYSPKFSLLGGSSQWVSVLDWLINGGDPNHLRPSWDDPPSSRNPVDTQFSQDHQATHQSNTLTNTWAMDNDLSPTKFYPFRLMLVKSDSGPLQVTSHSEIFNRFLQPSGPVLDELGRWCKMYIHDVFPLRSISSSLQKWKWGVPSPTKWAPTSYKWSHNPL